MTPNSEFVDFLLENMHGMGTVRSRKMFGGYGIYLNDLMFGLVADDTLFLKVDEVNNPFFEALELPHFEFEKKGKVMRMSYRQVPESALDDAEEMVEWSLRSYQAAQRAKC